MDDMTIGAASEASSPSKTRAEALRDGTHSLHETLDGSIMKARPFDSTENYARFVKMQHALHRDASPLYAQADLAALIPNLAALSRFDAVTQDAADLGVTLDTYQDAPKTAANVSLAEGLGWLYVIEGSNLGAAFLLKAAKKLGLSETNGARHLGEAPEGRATHWRAFKDALNAAALAPEDEDRVIAGANAAFARAHELARIHLA